MTQTRPASTRTRRGAAGVALAPSRRLEGPILVAADDGEATGGPLRLAELLARRDRVGVRVLGVVRPVGLPVWLSVDVDAQALEEGRRRLHEERVRARLHQTVGLGAFFEVEIATGSPAPVIAAAARTNRASVLLVGLTAHGSPGRATSEDSVLQLTRAADIPVVAVPAGCDRLFANALVAVDFSETSLRAARAVLPLLVPGATLTLAHVEPIADLRAMGREGWAEIYERGVAGLFASLQAQLSGASDVAVRTVLLEGEPVPALLDHAARNGCDLVASGTQGADARGPCLTGSVSTALLRGTSGAMLVAPPSVRP